MKIHNTLRTECMPEMVYSICKLAGSNKYKKSEIKRLITLNSKSIESSAQFNKVYKFSIECGFIVEDNETIVQVQFTKQQLADFKSFRYAIFTDVFKDSTTIFTGLCKWYLSQGSDIFNKKSAKDLYIKIPEYMLFDVENDYMLGFRSWIVTLGLAMLQKSGAGSTLVFATNQILADWLKLAMPFKKDKPILVKDFFNTLLTDCPVFSDCISGNDINLALSMGLRVLHQNKIINLGFTVDSDDIWHLTNSISNPKTNSITEITIM